MSVRVATSTQEIQQWQAKHLQGKLPLQPLGGIATLIKAIELELLSGQCPKGSMYRPLKTLETRIMTLIASINHCDDLTAEDKEKIGNVESRFSEPKLQDLNDLYQIVFNRCPPHVQERLTAGYLDMSV